MSANRQSIEIQMAAIEVLTCRDVLIRHLCNQWRAVLCDPKFHRDVIQPQLDLWARYAPQLRQARDRLVKQLAGESRSHARGLSTSAFVLKSPPTAARPSALKPTSLLGRLWWNLEGMTSSHISAAARGTPASSPVDDKRIS